MTTMRKQASCWDYRLARARLARKRARRRRAVWLLAWLLFVFAFLSPAVVLAVPGQRRPQGRASDNGDGGGSCTVSPHEADPAHVLRPRWSPQSGRYSGGRPNMARLLRDLRRPAARREAADMLLARLPAGETGLRDWVNEQLDAGSASALATWARPGMREEDIIAAWRGAARREADREIPAPSASPAP